MAGSEKTGYGAAKEDLYAIYLHLQKTLKTALLMHILNL